MKNVIATSATLRSAVNDFVREELINSMETFDMTDVSEEDFKKFKSVSYLINTMLDVIDAQAETINNMNNKLDIVDNKLNRLLREK